MHHILVYLLSYLIGSIPSAFLMTRLFKKVDIRREGSGNVGGMNTYSVAGLLPGVITIILDILKGTAAVLIAGYLSGLSYSIFIAGILAVLGHNYSIFLNFKGGKGLATTAGVFLALSPASIVYAIICAVALTLILRDTNTAFGIAALSIPIILAFQFGSADWIVFGAAMALIVAFKHLPDFRSYKNGRRKVLPEKR